ncbi:PREDICTED: HVA22-like protein e [Tarenaya hassleriana]|uniref:HVA22-like protein e n=1 Tax=Tarenaya hassleriana TaxID=28532 RepID=UPI00053C37E3|nr:PREDICTED: HVA22-like protein e [Tarenaya hassleriana]
MSKFWAFLSGVHVLAGPALMLLYPLYASVIAMESPSKEDDEQWLAYWILYSLLTLSELILQSALEWIPIWYTMKLVLVVWLVMPQTRGASFIYERFVRGQLMKYGIIPTKDRKTR